MAPRSSRRSSRSRRLGSAQDIQHQRSNVSLHHDINHDGRVNGQDETQYRHIAYGFTGVAAFGLTVGLLSTAGLARRKAQRRAQAAERKDLAGQREQLRKQLDYGISAGPQQLQLRVQGQFLGWVVRATQAAAARAKRSGQTRAEIR